MHRLILCLALAATPALAGGPVIIEDAAEPEPQHSFRDAVPFLLAGAIVLALIAGSGTNCNGGEPDGGKC